MLVQNISKLIGATPTLRLNNYEKANDISACLYAKLEYFNPGGSIKDRIALMMIRTAEQNGDLEPGGTIIEPTSGNTGISLVFLAAALGYKAIIVMPESMSEERRKILKAYGAELILTPAEKGMSGAIEEAKRIQAITKNSFMPNQFSNPSNPQAHRMTTAFELLSDIPNIDILVSAIGTGGTITGVGEELKKFNPNIEIIGVEPAESAVLSGGKAGPHGIQGIGAGFVPDTLNREVIDKIMTVSTQDAKKACKDMAHQEGAFVGISSGSALFAASQLAKMPENHKKCIAIIMPDTGQRYLSTDTFD